MIETKGEHLLAAYATQYIYDMMVRKKNLPNFMTQVCSSNGKYSAMKAKGTKRNKYKSLHEGVKLM